MMPVPAATASPDAAATFIANHTAVDEEVPLLEECPICLDNYSNEHCLRITGLSGCTHRIGQGCLERMLRRSPAKDTKCPLCRAVWIAAQAPAAAPARPTRVRPPMVPPRRVTSARRAEVANLLGDNIAQQQPTGIGLFGLGGAISGAPAQQRTQRGSPDVARPQRPQIVDLTSSDDDEVDYATHLNDYNELTRDIESIRTRARNTQLPRAERYRRERSNDLGAAGGAMNRFLLNPFRLSPPESSDAPRRQQSLRKSPEVARPRQSSVRTAARPAPRTRLDVPRPTPALNLGSSSSSDTVTANARPRVPFVSAQSYLNGNQAAIRAAQLDLREQELNQRGKCLSVREAALLVREQDVTAKEQRLEQVAALVQRQSNEMEELVARQREEMDRMSE
jgi:hypothetical protein